MSGRGAIGVGRTPVPLGIGFVAMLILLYLPIGVLFLFSFNNNTVLTFPLRELTLDWYGEVFADGNLLEAARNSLVVAIGAATAATGLGLAVSIAFLRFRFRGRLPLLALAVLPLIVPFIVLAVSLYLLFGFLDIERSLVTIAVGHSVIALPFATLILMARISGIDPALEDAAMDLGASYGQALRRVTIPLIGPTMLSAWLTSFIVSFDEVAIALFLAGRDPTFPVFLYGQLRFGPRLPVLIAAAVMLMLVTVTLTLLAFRLARRKPEAAEPSPIDPLPAEQQ
jgi:spermidine/putrescine transport system permease protein